MMNRQYGTITERTLTELAGIVGKAHTLTGHSELEGYSYDETPLSARHFPQVVVRPADAEEVARILALASKQKIPVTPRGAGTGLSGGCLPVCGGIVLSLERMNRMREISRSKFVAVVEPGVTLADLTGQVESLGLYYPIYPGEMTATIGGTIATNAGGMNAVKYGVTRHHVLGLEAVLPTGDIIRTGGEFAKCSTGYDLTQLIVGSEGTLALITRIILKLTTRPANREVLMVPFATLQNAINSVPEILRLNMTPTGIEFIEKSIIEIVEKYTGKELPYHNYDAFLLIIMEGESADEIHQHFSQIDRICRQHGAVEAMMPGSERAKRRLLDAREKFYHALNRYAPMEIIDAVVPPTEIARFVGEVKKLSAEYGIPVITYGHAGDGNVHLHPLCVNMDRKVWEDKLPDLMKDIYHTGVSFGGAISGEHGIGFNKKAYLPLQLDEASLGIMKAIKKAFDPHNILNPGKIFD